jgi:catechol 2,3-dioxygenase-like lactoylglutathione lyase family enzyme
MIYDHVAIKSSNIKRSVDWYAENWGAHVLYHDESWGLVMIGETKVSFVLPERHPPHICFEVCDDFIAQKLCNKTFKPHRDGSSSCYVRDPDGNFIEFLRWPEKVQ